MTLTREAMTELLATVVPHDGIEDAVVLPNGMIKTRRGLQIKQAKDARVTAGEVKKAAVSSEPAAPAVLPSQEGKAERVRKAGKCKLPEQPKEPDPVLVHVELPGTGKLPSQYAHFIPGDGVLVLGMNKFSFTPAQATVDTDGVISGTLAFSELPGSKWVHLGYRFRDTRGVTNIILIKSSEADYDDDNDGNTNQKEGVEGWQ